MSFVEVVPISEGPLSEVPLYIQKGWRIKTSPYVWQEEREGRNMWTDKGWGMYEAVMRERERGRRVSRGEG